MAYIDFLISIVMLIRHYSHYHSHCGEGCWQIWNIIGDVHVD